MASFTGFVVVLWISGFWRLVSGGFASLGWCSWWVVLFSWVWVISRVCNMVFLVGFGLWVADLLSLTWLYLVGWGLLFG